MSSRNAARRVRRCLSSLLATQPFFGHLALRLPIEEDRTRKTIASDGTVLRYNPEWVEEQPSDPIKAAIARVVMACALKHHTRRGERDYKRWQTASQMVTLPFLREAGLTDEQGGVDDAVERVYDTLPEEESSSDDQQEPQPEEQDGSGAPDQQGAPQPQAGEAEGDGEGGGDGDGDGEGDGGGEDGEQEAPPSEDPDGKGEIMDAPAPEGSSKAEEEAARQEAEQAWDEAAQQAQQAAKAAGSRPGKVRELLDAAHTHEIDWREELREFMTAAAANDYSWARPNRRHIDSGLYLPSLHSERVGAIVLAIDTSASMNAAALAAVWNEIRELAQDLDPEAVYVIQADTEVRKLDEYDAQDLPEQLAAHGRGGTAYTPTFRALEDLPTAAVMIYFTDLHCHDYPRIEPDTPVIWCVQPGGAETTPPWGRTIRMPQEGARE